jgi:hypothetical protein
VGKTTQWPGYFGIDPRYARCTQRSRRNHKGEDCLLVEEGEDVMRQVHCDGCGYAEPDGMGKPKITPITLLIVEDPRFPEGTKKYEADLCPNCQGMILHTYFKIPAEGKLELPAFIGPRKPEPVPEPTSFSASRLKMLPID